MIDTDRITLHLPRATTAAYVLFVERLNAAGRESIKTTHGKAAEECRKAMQAGGSSHTLIVCPRLAFLDSWIFECARYRESVSMGDELHHAWRRSAKREDPKELPPEPIDPKIMAAVRALPAEYLDQVRNVKPEKQATLFE